ncbi:hypothetical protein [Brevundimonas diminuta]|jgi:hypothetical protein|uniref:Uncharacterized protein n=2 Tax=Brevundimonas diminuta TaxID=293 RepID=A0A410NXJ9_BREDI|nr:hypothetical protein [Brevundimonas diminuta]QAT14609.1 hypothetical protein EQG53_09700 [Brevundimonas diminuta]
MSMASLDRTIARLSRYVRSRSNLRPVVLFSAGVMAGLLGVGSGLSNIAPTAFALSLSLTGVALVAVAVATVMLRPNAANDN